MDFILTIGLISLIIIAYLVLWPKRNLPPGLPSWPILGSLPYLDIKNLLEQLLKLHRKYGDVMTIHMGSKPYVFLNSYNVIKEAFVAQKEYFSDRPDSLFVNMLARVKGETGMILAKGDTRNHVRGIVAKALNKTFNVGKTQFENNVMEEVHVLLDHLDEKTKPYDMRWSLTMCTSNIVHVLNLGKRFAYDDESFQEQLEGEKELFEFFIKAQILDPFPLLRFLPGDIFGYKKCLANQTIRNKFFTKHLEENQENDCLLKHWKEMAKEDPNSIEIESLIVLVYELFEGSIHTNSSTLYIALAYMLNNPGVQEKIHKLIDENIGQDRQPTIADRKHLQYIDAVCYETLRLMPIGPMGIPHICSKTTTLAGYTIPESAILIPNLYAVHHDPNTWPNPEKFDPSRFIDEEGKLQNHDKIIPFSMGKRVCPGKEVAKMSLFLVLTSLLQRYHFSVPPGESPPSLKVKLGLTLELETPYKVCIIKR
ncbi:unnamed protein product [Owenia fusiformis]|uniref:Uncharacterized protein n=1 Tax=Owenia fusiformis TaxID=6347 RepID=A0A8J1U4D0_OWEFU|nr:unnamed protein product [Owenia fusiformis]